MKPDSLLTKETTDSVDNERRFSGIARVYGDAGLARLIQSHVCVVGVGGVGSWVVESLARSGVGCITMIDMDIVAESNINRQLLALTETIGRDKVIVLQERIQQINPDCTVHMVDEFLTRDNLSALINNGMDFVVDCIDDFRTKAALISYCKKNKIKVLTVGAAGGQCDPSKIRQTDFSVTQHDALLAKTRRLLRQDYGFPRNLKRSFSIPCVYSDEQAVYPDGLGGLTKQRPADNDNSDSGGSLNCAGGIGSITHVTASFAFVASAYVLNMLATNNRNGNTL